MTDQSTTDGRPWSQKTGLLAVVAALTVAVVGTCSYITWSTYWGPEAVARKNAKSKKATKPRWTELSATQREALSPLASEWDRISPAGKKKWLQIGDRIALMGSEEKQRAQQRLRDWVKLTPEQRKVARANYALAQKKLKPSEKIVQWENYQQLTEEQRKELAAADAPDRKKVVNPPAYSEKNAKVARSVKATPREELEKSVQPSEVAAPPAPAPAAPAKNTTSDAAPV